MFIMTMKFYDFVGKILLYGTKVVMPSNICLTTSVKASARAGPTSLTTSSELSFKNLFILSPEIMNANCFINKYYIGIFTLI